MSTLLSDGSGLSCDAGDATDVDTSTACSAEYEDQRVGNVEVGNAAGYGIVAGDLHTTIVEGHALYIPATTGTTTIGVALGEVRVSEFPGVRGRVFSVPGTIPEGWPLTILTEWSPMPNGSTSYHCVYESDDKSRVISTNGCT